MKDEHTFYYTHVSVDWKTANASSVGEFPKSDVRVQRYGIAENEKDTYQSNENKNMEAILNSHPRAVPEKISSVGYGTEFHVQPYWNEHEKNIIKEVQSRVKQFGLAGVIPCDKPLEIASKLVQGKEHTKERSRSLELAM